MTLEKVKQLLVSYEDYLETKQLLLQRLSDITSEMELMLINNEEESIDEALNSRQVIMDKIDELEQQRCELISLFQGASGKSILSKCESLDILKLETSNVNLLKDIFSKNILIDKKIQERDR
ncbi:MAG: hypothetical protein M0T74_12810, partial [Desulfitobacterium hafniense]|nr:hypothetical protein [Desulfitobacterium hafniense]